MTEVVDNKLGNIIRSARKAKGMTQEELAAKVGVTKAIISKYELGQIKNYTRPRIQALAKALDISPLVFVGFESPQSVTFEPKNAHKITDLFSSQSPTVAPVDIDVIDTLASYYANKVENDLGEEYISFKHNPFRLGPHEPEQEKKKVQVVSMTAEEKELLRIYRGLSVKRRIGLLNMAYQLEEEQDALLGRPPRTNESQGTSD